MDRFVNSILSQAPGCPKFVIKQHVLRAAIKFCTETWVWQAKESISVSEDDTTADLTITSGAAVTGIPSLKLYDRDFTDYTRSGETITFDDALAGDGTLDVTEALMPTRDSTSLNDYLYTYWYDGIEAGALHTLHAMQGKPWYDPAASRAAWLNFYREVGDAKMKARLKNDVDGIRVASVRFV